MVEIISAHKSWNLGLPSSDGPANSSAGEGFLHVFVMYLQFCFQGENLRSTFTLSKGFISLASELTSFVLHQKLKNVYVAAHCWVGRCSDPF